MKATRVQMILIFTLLLAVEFIFRIQAGQFGFNNLLIRSLLMVMMLSSILIILNALTRSRIITSLTIIYAVFINAYAFFQISMRSYYEAFFSSRFLRQEMPNVQSYASDFIHSIKLGYFIYPIILLVFIPLYLKTRKHQALLRKGKPMLFVMVIPMSLFLSYSGLLRVDTQIYVESSVSLFKNPFYTESAMNQLGLLSFMGTDLQYIFLPGRAVQNIDLVEDDREEELPSVEYEDPKIRKFDDTLWKSIQDEETNTLFKDLDQYFMSQEITRKNEKTGVFESMNLVYFLVEAFDELAIHPTLTPTLYKLKTEGIYFQQFLSPQFNCATAESELMSVSSLYPVVGTCTMSNYYKNTNPQSIYNLFKAKGYSTSSFHNWTDQFYPRSVIHPVLGSDVYKDESVTIPSRVSGWQSDLTMMHTVVKDLNNTSGPFMSYVITSSTHFPYDVNSNLGDKYFSQVKAVLPDAPDDIIRYMSKAKELDASIAYLIEHLEAIDNTVLVLFSDHRPFKLQSGDIEKFTYDPAPSAFFDATPFMIYTPKIQSEKVTKVSSTIDLVPTLANMFNLDYDPRLYMGSDIFSYDNNRAIFQNGSWRDQIGRFDTNSSKFTPYDEARTYTDEEVIRINALVNRKLAVSSQVYLNGYFNEREFLRP